MSEKPHPLAEFFKTTKASFAIILGVCGALAGFWSYLIAVPLPYAALTVLGPGVVWWLCQRDQRVAMAAKDATIKDHKDREAQKYGEVFGVTGAIRRVAAKLPFHVGSAYGAGGAHYVHDLAPSKAPDGPEYAALRGKMHEAYLWVERWCSDFREAYKPFSGYGTRKFRPDEEASLMTAGRFKDEIMKECDALEAKALRGELRLPPPVPQPTS